MKDFHFDAIAAFENYEIEEMKGGRVVVTTKVVDSSLNYYGNAHGGYLFTLCDQISGLVLISQGVDGVTLQSSINYLKAGRLGDVLTIRGHCVHAGRTTRVVDVVIANQEGANVCKATFTMFVTGERKEEARVRI
ncbi:PaaI family thioesterase [Streptococcus panodentis]|uniref:Thioesterase n=1 Tax=Streptococcus panodentis TaxID=1581472 RepID=A0ABS5AXY9_9STRE|nr:MULTISPECIES: PaaI family thioesterase [Streptococcus]MBP2621436.1 thioesterase [Streptococcus panodentis]